MKFESWVLVIEQNGEYSASYGVALRDCLASQIKIKGLVSAELSPPGWTTNSLFLNTCWNCPRMYNWKALLKKSGGWK